MKIGKGGQVRLVIGLLGLLGIIVFREGSVMTSAAQCPIGTSILPSFPDMACLLYCNQSEFDREKNMKIGKGGQVRCGSKSSR